MDHHCMTQLAAAASSVGAAVPSPWRSLVCGVDRPVAVRGGAIVPGVLLDNAASTPPLRRVRDAVHELADLYSSVHRGTGSSSRASTALYEEARATISRLVGADPTHDTVVFVRHTTDALNRVAYQLGRRDDALVLVTAAEHHANLLPWRQFGRTVMVEVDAAGRVDVGAVADALRANIGRIAVVAVTGASNVTGHVTPIHEIAALAHRHGALIAVDGAQLVPHRRVDMLSHTDAGHIDIIAFSGHKLYAPYGAGALVVPRRLFQGAPQIVGGGAVRFVGDDETLWSDLPEREEAGSPNVIGAAAMALAMQHMAEHLGMDRTDAHEVILARRMREGLLAIDGISLLGEPATAESDDRLGLVSFTVEGMPHGLVGAALAHEHGISVRSGCFCAHPYLVRLLDVPEVARERLRAEIRAGHNPSLPGAVRASVALFSDSGDVDRLVAGIAAIRDRTPTGYVEGAHGEWYPTEGWPEVRGLQSLGRSRQGRP